MIKLTDVALSFPILSCSMKITHFSARVSTAIEWVILEAINKIEQHPNTDYARYSVDLFFSQIFLIGMEGDSNLLIKPCLFNLMDRNAIYTNVALSDDTDLREFPINALQLTESGREMQKKGLLPGEDSEVQYSVLYDLTSRKVKSFKEKNNLASQPSGIVIYEDTENPLNAPLPIIQIKDYLLEIQKHQQTAPGWLRTDTEIKDIVLDNSSGESPVSVLWENKTYSLHCYEDMKISVGNLQDDSIFHYILNDIEKKDLRNSMTISKIPAIDVRDVDSELKKLLSISDIRTVLIKLIDNDTVFFINDELIDFDFDGIMKNTSGKICVVFGTTDFSIENTKNLVIRLPKTAKKIQTHALYGNKAESIYVGKFNLKSAASSKDIYLCYSQKNQNEDISGIIRFVLDAPISETNFDLIYLLLVINENDIFLKKLNSILDRKNTYKEKIALIDQVYKTSERLSLRLDIKKNDLYLEHIKWNFGADNEVEEIIQIINEIKNNDTFKGDSNLTEKALTRIFTNWKYCSDITILWDVLGKCKIDRNIIGWLKNSPAVKKLFSDEILNQMLNLYKNENFVSITVYTKFEEILIDLKKNLEEFNRILKPHVIPLDLSHESLKNIILRGRFDLSKLNELVKKHNELIAGMNIYLAERKQLIQDTAIISMDNLTRNKYFTKAENNINVVADTVMEFFNENALKYDRIYVVDTCALMNKPELVDRFIHNKAALIIPKIVIEELNRNKDFRHDEEKSSKAQKAISRLNKHEQTKAPWLIMEESHPELLPPEYPLTVKDKVQEKEVADNLILSVILNYKAKKAILITDDKNLQLKASSEKMSYQSSDSFLGSK